MDIKSIIPAQGLIPHMIELGRQNFATTDEFLYGAVIGVIGCALSKRVKTYLNGRVLTTNLFILLLGPTGSGKTTAADYAANALARADYALLARDMLVSNESFIQFLKIAEEKTGTRILFVVNEFASLLSNIGREYASALGNMLINAYDGNSLRLFLRRGDTYIESPCASMIACSTAEKVLARVKEGIVSGGLLPRYIPIIVSRDILRHNVTHKAWNQEYYKKICTRLSAFVTHCDRTIMLDTTAQRLYREWMEEEDKLNKKVTNDDELAFYVRLPLMVMKVALIYDTTLCHVRKGDLSQGLCDGNTMELAIKAGCWFRENIKELVERLSYTEDRKNQIDVLMKVRQHYKRTKSPCPQRDIYRDLHLPSKKANTVIHDLALQERVMIVKIAKERGRTMRAVLPWGVELKQEWIIEKVRPE